MTAGLSLATLQPLLETESLGRCALYRRRVSSTMDVAREEAEAGAPHGLIVVAEEQTEGRGLRGRRWLSPPGGNIYVTIVVRPDPRDMRSLAMVAPLAACEAIEAIAETRCAIKWPNDILIAGRKVAGLLIDTHLGGGDADYALVGIGINVNVDPSQFDELRGIATSLAAESGRELSREMLLAALLSRFESLYAAARLDDSVYHAWRARLETLGRTVRVQLGDRVDEGVAEDVDAEGNLLLRRSDGGIVSVSAGDVTLAP